MRNKLLSLSGFVGSLSLLIMLGVLASGPLAAQLSEAPAPTAKQRAKMVKQITRCLDTKAYAYAVDFGDWPQRIAAESEALDSAQTAGDFTRVINRALAGYGISHLFLLDPLLTELKEQGAEVGAGFRTVPDPDGLGRLVNVVIPGGPAERIGLRKGDLIVAVDGEPLDADALRYPFSPGGRLLGRAEKPRLLRWQRDGAIEEASVGFERHAKALPLSLTWPETDTAWMTVNSFSAASYDPNVIERFFAEVRARNAEYLVLDLRGNGGGRTTNTDHLASFLVEPDTVMTRIFSADPGIPPGESLALAGKEERLDIDRGAQRFEGKLAILTDQGSGSGGDAFPGIMRQVRGALLVGERTAGRLIGGSLLEIGKGYQLVYPLQERLLPDGTRVEGVGVAPDIALGPAKTLDDAYIARVTLEALRAGKR